MDEGRFFVVWSMVMQFKGQSVLVSDDDVIFKLVDANEFRENYVEWGCGGTI